MWVVVLGRYAVIVVLGRYAVIVVLGRYVWLPWFGLIWLDMQPIHDVVML